MGLNCVIQKLRTVVTPVLLALIMLQPGISAARTLTETLNVEPGERLLLRSDVGRIEVTGHAKSTVVVDVEIFGLDEDEFTPRAM